MSFGSHLDELRGRLFRSVLALFGLFLVAWFFHAQLEEIVLRPHHQAVGRLNAAGIEIETRMQLLSYTEAIFFDLRIALICSLLVGFPYLLWELWGFIGAGLYKQERRAVTRFIPFSLLFAIAGVLFGYLFMIPLALEFLGLMTNQELMRLSLRLSDYFSLFLLLTLALALIFQLPLILLGLSAAGMVQSAWLREHRRHFIVFGLLFCAFMTPPEPYTQMALAIPLIVLFELGVLLVSIRERSQREERP